MERHEQVSTLHKQFPLSFSRFFQNREWNSTEGSPEIKLLITFDDLELINDCPFVCKIAINLKGGLKYFGIAYGKLSDHEALKEWAKRFPDASLLTMKGNFIEDIKRP